MLIYDVLKKDHEGLKNLLQQLDESTSAAIKKRRDLLERVRDEWVPHARAEEKVLYDTLKEISGTEDLALEAYEEHSTAESILRELELMDPGDDRWHAKLNVLKDTVEHHISEEESEIFDAAQQVLAEEEAEMMAEAFTNLKEQVRNGSVLQTALAAVAQYMPARFASRFTDISRRITT
jgi:hemerythrin-like domain-containing protein